MQTKPQLSLKIICENASDKNSKLTLLKYLISILISAQSIIQLQLTDETPPSLSE